MGRIADPWRATDDRVRRGPVDGLKIDGATFEAAVANLEDFLQSHAEAIVAIDMCVIPTLSLTSCCVPNRGAWPTTVTVVRGGTASDSRVVGPTDHRGFPLGISAGLSGAR